MTLTAVPHIRLKSAGLGLKLKAVIEIRLKAQVMEPRARDEGRVRATQGIASLAIAQEADSLSCNQS